jgi:hypothetical protein
MTKEVYSLVQSVAIFGEALAAWDSREPLELRMLE